MAKLTLLAVLVLHASGVSAQDYARPTTWQIRIQATSLTEAERTDALCLVRCDSGVEVACGTPDASGQVALTTGPIGCVQAVARNAAGSSGVSAEKAYAQVFRAGDCNRDGNVTVSDLVCTNIAIFSGG